MPVMVLGRLRGIPLGVQVSILTGPWKELQKSDSVRRPEKENLSGIVTEIQIQGLKTGNHLEACPNPCVVLATFLQFEYKCK